MIPLPFRHVVAESADEAIALLQEHGDEAKILAGGHSLLPLLKLRLAAPSVLVDVSRIPELRFIREEGDTIAIGALARHRDLEASPLLGLHAPLLRRAAAAVGDPQVRNRGTLGGSVAHGDAAGDLPAAVLASRASLVVQGASGRRIVGADDFFRGFLDTDVGEDEMLVEVRVPKVTGAGWSYQKLNRRSQDYAVVAAAVVLGDCPGVALVNMGSTPLRAAGVEAALAAGSGARAASASAAAGTEPASDHNASAEDREHLARVLVQRALTEAGLPD